MPFKSETTNLGSESRVFNKIYAKESTSLTYTTQELYFVPTLSAT